MKKLFFNAAFLFVQLSTVTIAFAAATKAGSSQNQSSPSSNFVYDNKKMTMNKSHQLIESLREKLSEKYITHMGGKSEVRYLISLIESSMKNPPQEVENYGTDVKTLEGGLYVTNIELEDTPTIKLFEEMNSLVEQSPELRNLFSEIDTLVLDFTFHFWGLESLMRGISLDPVEKFVSFFPNLKKLYLRLDGLNNKFKFPIPANLSKIEELYVFLIKNVNYFENKEVTSAWFNSWNEVILERAEQNKSLIILKLHGLEIDKEFDGRIKDLVESRSNSTFEMDSF